MILDPAALRTEVAVKVLERVAPEEQVIGFESKKA